MTFHEIERWGNSEDCCSQDSRRRLKNFCVHFGNNVYTHASVVANVTNLHKCCHSPRRLTDSAKTTTASSFYDDRKRCSRGAQILQNIDRGNNQESSEKCPKDRRLGPRKDQTDPLMFFPFASKTKRRRQDTSKLKKGHKSCH